MNIHSFRIKNFKSFEDVSFYFNHDLNILTGTNNSGKTTVLEALSLWHECFTKLITEAKRGEKGYKRGDYILGPSSNKYFAFEEINSVRSPHFDDIFHQRERKNAISLSLTLIDKDSIELCIPFKISSSGNNYIIELEGYKSYDHRAFNDYFAHLPEAISLIYSTPVAQITLKEDFVTGPKIQEQLLLRHSDVVLRNRLYKIIQGLDSSLNTSFQNDLNYILFNAEKKLEFDATTNIQKDAQAVILFKIGAKDVYKDLSLLGSGTLQIIGILLNLYAPSELQTDLRIVLLDEPDSHIHRDLQKRLIEVLNKFGQGIQIFATTHNESLIRNTAPNQIFHLEGKPIAEIRSIDSSYEPGHLGMHFKGIMPGILNPVMRSIGSTTGLDFVNALECDRLIFVEGEDDAKAFRILLNQQINNRKKYMFWVLGGISEIFENILSYKAFFSNLKNGTTLWDKSVLIFDKDELSNEHKEKFVSAFKDRLGIAAYCPDAYTFESTLFTDLQKTSRLLSRFIKQANEQDIPEETICDALKKNYEEYSSVLTEKFDSNYHKEAYYRYKNSKIEKANGIFKTKKDNQKLIMVDDYSLGEYIKNYYSDSLTKQECYKLMDKHDVEKVIQSTITAYGVSFSIESDFLELIKLVDKSAWISEWDFLNRV